MPRTSHGDEEWVRFAAIEALTKIGDESCLGMLIGALSGSSDLVASMIVDGLGAMGNMKAAPLLLAQWMARPLRFA
jgi:HEAT repeat protein